jgi:hypothetical protein
VKTLLDDLLSRYRFTTPNESLQALREIIQEIALVGFWRGKFFEHAAFYGGSALRIVHGLPRYSEDMDFSLMVPSPGFKVSPYFAYVEKELRAFGFDVSIVQRPQNAESAIEGAFVKMNTREGFLTLGVPRPLVERLAREQVLKIKLETDIDPPDDFRTETKYLYVPQAFSVRLFDLPSQFAGKLHAAIARKWKTRVKGRDWFDLVWFVGKGVSASLAHLKARLVQTGHLARQDLLGVNEAREILSGRIITLDIDAAKRDVGPFLRPQDAAQLDIWSKDFFLDLAHRIKFE